MHTTVTHDTLKQLFSEFEIDNIIKYIPNRDILLSMNSNTSLN